MAHLLRVKSTCWTLNGVRVSSDTPGAVKQVTVSKKWYGAKIPGLPKSKRVPLAVSKKASQRMLDDMVRAFEEGRAGLPNLESATKTLAELIGDFERDLSLGLASRKPARTPPSPKQVMITTSRVRVVVQGIEANYVSDLIGSDAKVVQFLRDKLTGDWSSQTAAFTLAAMKRFAWWLSARAKANISPTVFDSIHGFDPNNNRVHARRALTPDEQARLVEAAKSGVTIRGVTGPERSVLYLVALNTGLRAGELAKLTPECFELGNSPTVTLSGKHTKNKRSTTLPLSESVAAALRVFIKDKPQDQLLWPGTWSVKPQRILKADLKLADIKYRIESPAGPLFADFHSLRHTYVTSLVNSGASAKQVQTLARHATPSLTLGLYTHTTTDDLRSAVESLPLSKVNTQSLTVEQAFALGVMWAVLGFPPSEPNT